MNKIHIKALFLLILAFLCNGTHAQEKTLEQKRKSQISKPLVEHVYTADPSAHVFNEKLYIYPSHDTIGLKTDDSPGGGFTMVDYHVFSMEKEGGKVTDYGKVLGVEDIPWAHKQLWAPDAAHKDGKYYLYFPAKGDFDIFRIGVAVGNSPSGPFVAEPEPIKGSYSIDPSVFEDEDGSYYMYFGGIDGGQLQHYRGNTFGVHYNFPDQKEAALKPRVAKMSSNMLAFAEAPKEVAIVDENGKLLKGYDHDRRFFEAAWVHKFNNKYYFSYSTGDTHKICYAIGDSPYGPFTYKGVVLEPVVGWTSHHSICKFKGKWYLFYHDSLLSNGNTILRSIKMTELKHDENGCIQTIKPYGE